MGIQKRLRDAVQRKSAVVVPHLDTVEAIQEHVKQHAHVETVPPICVDLCVMSISAFNRGWHCVLIDNEAAGDVFPAVKRDFDALKFREQRDFIFRLTIWRGKKNPRREPNFVEGSSVFVKEVNDLKTYNDVCQGIAEMDDLIKQEDETMEEKPAKKAKTSQAA